MSSVRQPATSSGLKVADAVICDKPCILLGVHVIADGTNQATAILYDNASAASGTAVAKVIVDAALTYQDANIPANGIVCNQGIFLDIGGTGAECIVEFIPSG